jgi:hypothetical protein
MIIAFADDQTVQVFTDIASVRSQCEAIDVEDGIYHFFDEYGRPLKPRIITPVQRTSLPFGVKLIDGGTFDLELDAEDERNAFDALLAHAVVIEPNRRFETIADLTRFVDANRRGKNGL